MDILPRDVLMYVHAFAAPTLCPTKKRSASSSDLSWGQVPSAMKWLADCRLVNRQWRNTIDDPKSLVWYYTAQGLGLEPPLQLYAGGTHKDVCKFLLKAEREKQEATKQAANTRGLGAACGIRRGPRFHEAHPHPERPMVKLPDDLANRVAANAKALESFLRSVNFAALNDSCERWHESALNRHRMFLKLKLDNPGIWLMPTADIEFCWLAHIFRTGAYWKDLTTLGIEPDHSLCLSYGEVATYSTAIEATKTLWDGTFGPDFPYLPAGTNTEWKIWKVERPFFGCGNGTVSRRDPRRFFPQMGPEILDLPDEMKVVLPHIHLTADEIRADLQWFPQLQEAFRELNHSSYDVMRGGKREQLMTKQVIPSYERFLNLCNRENKDFSPPHVLDLVWHAHQMEPVLYKAECLTLFGREFLHEPWPVGLGVSSPLTNEFECAWKEAYGTPIVEDWKLYLGAGRSRAHW